MDAICMAMILLDMNCRVVIYSAADHLINPLLHSECPEQVILSVTVAIALKMAEAQDFK
jgi:hypothetical protein